MSDPSPLPATYEAAVDEIRTLRGKIYAETQRTAKVAEKGETTKRALKGQVESLRAELEREKKRAWEREVELLSQIRELVAERMSR